jgi:inositol 1,4,5-triphosphate receptor type 1
VFVLFVKGYFVNVEFFTLQLLDVVAISPVIADIIRSVTSPGVALGLVFYLFVITVIIYAAFGMNHFSSSLLVNTQSEDGTENQLECGSMLQCFYFIFSNGLSEGGNMGGFLSTNYAGEDSYTMRIFFDSVFFVWVGIVLMNIITGLMVDTFSSIREEKQSRAEILDTVCFVCDTLRRSYDDMNLGPEAPSFDLHISVEHDPWTYVYYLAYLKKKNPEEDSGTEHYVRREVAKKSINWVPMRTSFFIEASKKQENSSK